MNTRGLKELDVSNEEISMLKEIQSVQADPDRRRQLACEEGASRLAKSVFSLPGEGKIRADDDRTQHVAALIRSGLVVYHKTDKKAARYQVSPLGLQLLKQLQRA